MCTVPNFHFDCAQGGMAPLPWDDSSNGNRQRFQRADIPFVGLGSLASSSSYLLPISTSGYIFERAAKKAKKNKSYGAVLWRQVVA
jgi:hypothetical protein